jgi:NDP-sugar pyrophosphorylase family protein
MISVEKPESYLSSLINCGIYLFSLEIFDYIREELSKNQNADFTNTKYVIYFILEI